MVSPSGVGKREVCVKDEKIVAVSEPATIASEAARVIDASAKIVVPGGVEPHAHVGSPRQPERSRAEAVSRAAIYGGTTTVLDFANQIPGHDLHHALGEAAERWKDNAYTDYSYHPIFTKGAIAPGSDADITIIDPSIRKPLSMDDLHLEDYSIWEDWEIQGWPVTTILRGKVMVENGELLGSTRDGCLIPRKVEPEVTTSPIC